MIKENNTGDISSWIHSSIHLGIKEMTSFAKGLELDFSALKNALTLPWSNRLMEGIVHRLMTIKSQMYSKASFELLRRRFILLPT